MYRMASAWRDDMAFCASFSVYEVFHLLKKMLYHPDPPGREVLQRPFYTIRGWGPGGDCDDKAIAAGAWMHLREIPFRFVAVSNTQNKPLHHVYTEINIGGRGWIAFDPTYAFNVLGRPMAYFPVKYYLPGTEG